MDLNHKISRMEIDSVIYILCIFLVVLLICCLYVIPNVQEDIEAIQIQKKEFENNTRVSSRNTDRLENSVAVKKERLKPKTPGLEKITIKSIQKDVCMSCETAGPAPVSLNQEVCQSYSLPAKSFVKEICQSFDFTPNDVISPRRRSSALASKKNERILSDFKASDTNSGYNLAILCLFFSES